MRRKLNGLLFILLFLVIFVCALPGIGASAYGEEKAKKDLPDREIVVSPEYTGVVVGQGEDVSIDVTVTNGGKKDEDIDLNLTNIPDGWKAYFKTYSFAVTGVHVRSDKSKNLTLKAEPDETVGTGEYVFGIEAKTKDGRLTSSSQVVVTVKGEAEKITKEVKIVTSYPVLRGPTDGKFEFSLEVDNKVDKDTIYNLAAKGPENWEINFKPAYEDKFISSLRLKANQSQTMAVEVKPYPWEKPGEYPILVKVSSPEAKGEAQLMVVLTGTHKLEVGTADGLLSLTAMRGEKANISVYIKNDGSATLNNVRFISFKPENWKLEFNPEKIESIAPQELKQIEVSITPTEQALVGDYSVGLNAESGRVSKTVELRVTVRASTAWGWIGIGIILLVLLGLVVLFIRFGRR